MLPRFFAREIFRYTAAAAAAEYPDFYARLRQSPYGVIDVCLDRFKIDIVTRQLNTTRKHTVCRLRVNGCGFIFLQKIRELRLCHLCKSRSADLKIIKPELCDKFRLLDRHTHTKPHGNPSKVFFSL